MMSGKEKLYFLLNRIDDIREIAPKGQPLKIHATHDLNNNYRGDELDMLFTKLEKDDQVIRVLKSGNRIKEIGALYGLNNPDDGCYHIKLLSAFDDYYQKIQEEPEYQKFTGKTPQVLQSQNKTQSKPNKKALEKIWNVLQEIEEKRVITAKGDDIAIPQVDFSKILVNEADKVSDERFNIHRKLEEERAIKDMRWPYDHTKLVYLKLGDKYFDVFSQYEEEYKKGVKDYQETRQVEEEAITDFLYKVNYSEQTRKILINNFLVKELRSFSENDAIFAYLYKNPNEDKTDKDIKKGTRLGSIKDLNKFIENIGFKRELRKVFFKVSKNKIRFNNPVTKEYLNELGIEHLKLG